MRFSNSLDRLFASGGHLTVLRELWRTRHQELTGRQLARGAGLSSAQTARVLRALHDEGLALSRSAGPSFLWHWNADHLWASKLAALFEAEARVRSELLEDIRVAFRELPVLDVRVFGSFSRGNERVDSDIDVFVETSDEQTAKSVRDSLNERSPLFWRKYGNPISPLILTTREIRRIPYRELIKSIREEGIEVASSR